MQEGDDGMKTLSDMFWEKVAERERSCRLTWWWHYVQWKNTVCTVRYCIFMRLRSLSHFTVWFIWWFTFHITKHYCFLVLVRVMFTLAFYKRTKSCKHEETWSHRVGQSNSLIGQFWWSGDLLFFFLVCDSKLNIFVGLTILSVGQNKQLEGVTSGFRKLWFLFFTVWHWHFVDNINTILQRRHANSVSNA